MLVSVTTMLHVKARLVRCYGNVCPKDFLENKTAADLPLIVKAKCTTAIKLCV